MVALDQGEISTSIPVLVDFRQVREMRIAVLKCWKDGDINGVITTGGALLALHPNDGWAAATRLRAALKGEDTDLIIECALQAAPYIEDAVPLATSRLMRLGNLLGAAHVVLASRVGANGASEAAASLAARLLKAGNGASEAGDAAEADRFWLAGFSLDPANKTLLNRVAKAKRKAVVLALETDIEADSQAYADAWSRVAELDPENLRALKRLATGSDRCGNFASAMVCWRRLMELSPEDHVARDRFLRAAKRAGRVIEGLDTLLQVGVPTVQLRSDLRLLSLAAGEVRQELEAGNIGPLIVGLAVLGRIDPESPSVLSLRHKSQRLLKVEARAALAEGREMDTVRLACGLLSIDPANAFALRVLSRLAYRFRDYPAAQNLVRQLISQEPDVSAHRELLLRIEGRLATKRPVEVSV